MYHRDDSEQLTMEEFFQPFGGRLRKRQSMGMSGGIMPWEYIEDIYTKNLSEETGRPAISSRIALARSSSRSSATSQTKGTVQELQENSYMQYFLGLHEFQAERLFESVYDGAFPQAVPVKRCKNQRVCLHREWRRSNGMWTGTMIRRMG